MEHVSFWSMLNILTSILCENITVRKNTEALLEASREAGLEVNKRKLLYIVMSRQQNAEQNRNLLIAKKSFENAANFEYFRMTVINKNCICNEIKSR